MVRKTGCAAYLGSNDLVDLRTLFNEGELTKYSPSQLLRHAFARTARGTHTHAGLPLSP